jgi:lysophospholipid acyltransferase (LPLAT)-like uncharacterized protein
MTGSSILARLAGILIALLRGTLRVDRLHYERYTDLRARGTPVLFSLWHGRMFLPIQAHRHRGVVTMASRSKDGEIIALWLERNGYVVVRGSTTRGGSDALRQMVRQVRSGRDAALTVDGPQGPPRIAQAGVVQLARLTGGWIVPVSASSSRPRFLRSWDRYQIPGPFSRSLVVYGEAFPIPPEMTDEAARAKISDAINAVMREADAVLGVTPPLEPEATVGSASLRRTE